MSKFITFSSILKKVVINSESLLWTNIENSISSPTCQGPSLKIKSPEGETESAVFTGRKEIENTIKTAIGSALLLLIHTA